MICPYCGSDGYDKVIQTCSNLQSIRRRRKCEACGKRYWTVENTEGAGEQEPSEGKWIKKPGRSSVTFTCSVCRKDVHFCHGSTEKTRKNGVMPICRYTHCPWCKSKMA